MTRTQGTFNHEQTITLWSEALDIQQRQLSNDFSSLGMQGVCDETSNTCVGVVVLGGHADEGVVSQISAIKRYMEGYTMTRESPRIPTVPIIMYTMTITESDHGRLSRDMSPFRTKDVPDVSKMRCICDTTAKAPLHKKYLPHFTACTSRQWEYMYPSTSTLTALVHSSRMANCGSW